MSPAAGRLFPVFHTFFPQMGRDKLDLPACLWKSWVLFKLSEAAGTK
jgi:hypothetical protein